MIYSKTKKLFFGKYLYKYEIYNSLTQLFYNDVIKRFDETIVLYEKQLLDQKKNGVLVPTLKFNNGYRYRVIDDYIIDQIKQIKNLLVEYKNEFRSRVEYNSLFIYTNNEQLIDKLEANTFADSRATIYKPDNRAIGLMTENKEVYVVDKPSEYEYRLTVSGKPKNSEEIARWLENNSEKIKASAIAINGFKRGYWLSSLIFYARDEKILTLAQIMLSDSLQKVEKIVYVEDIAAKG